MKTFRIGTRSSSLALWQANRVREEWESRGHSVEIVPVKTTGDRNLSGPISRIGAQGVFTREIETALLENRIDLAVHSLKDLPTELADGLDFTATLPRGAVGDVIVSGKVKNLDALPDGSRIGTGSLRRRCQLLHRLRGRKIIVEEIRGNVETRLRKLDAGDYNAVILAAAGLIRLGLADRITDAGRLDPTEFYPAVGQGALGLESRIDDEETNAVLRSMNDPETYLAVRAERRMLLELHGGCIAPIGAVTRWSGDRLTLAGRILSLDGVDQFDASAEARFLPPPNADTTRIAVTPETILQAESLGSETARKLIALGADAIIAEINRLRENGGTP